MKGQIKMIDQKIEKLKQEAELAETLLIKNLKNARSIKLANKVQNIISSSHGSLSDTSFTALNSLSEMVQLDSLKKNSVPNALIAAAKIISAFIK